MNFKRIMETAEWDKLCKNDMDKLTHVMNEFFLEVEKTMPETVKSTLHKVSFAVAENMLEDTAKYLVPKLEKGEHWDYETAKSVKPEEYECPSWYYMLNKVYSCLYDANKTTEDYVDHASDMLKMFHGNAKKYYMAMHFCY